MGAVVPANPRRLAGSRGGGARRERAPSHASGCDAAAAGRRVAANRLNGPSDVNGSQSLAARSQDLLVPLRHFTRSSWSP